MLIVADFQMPLPDVVVVRIVGRRDFHAAGAQFGLRPGVGDERNLAAGQRQLQHAAGAGHVAEFFQLRQHFALPALDFVDLGLNLRLLLGRGVGQPLAKLVLPPASSAAAGSGCTATAVSPSMVSGRVVAMVTCVGSPGFGIDHRIVEVPEMALAPSRGTLRRR